MTCDVSLPSDDIVSAFKSTEGFSEDGQGVVRPERPTDLLLRVAEWLLIR